MKIVMFIESLCVIVLFCSIFQVSASYESNAVLNKIEQKIYQVAWYSVEHLEQDPFEKYLSNVAIKNARYFALEWNFERVVKVGVYTIESNDTYVFDNDYPFLLPTAFAVNHEDTHEIHGDIFRANWWWWERSTNGVYCTAIMDKQWAYEYFCVYQNYDILYIAHHLLPKWYLQLQNISRHVMDIPNYPYENENVEYQVDDFVWQFIYPVHNSLIQLNTPYNSFLPLIKKDNSHLVFDDSVTLCEKISKSMKRIWWWLWVDYWTMDEWFLINQTFHNSPIQSIENTFPLYLTHINNQKINILKTLDEHVAWVSEYNDNPLLDVWFYDLYTKQEHTRTIEFQQITTQEDLRLCPSTFRVQEEEWDVVAKIVDILLNLLDTQQVTRYQIDTIMNQKIDIAWQENDTRLLYHLIRIYEDFSYAADVWYEQVFENSMDR